MDAVMELAKKKRGVYIKSEFVSDRMRVIDEIPLSEVIVDFNDLIKSVTRGYGSIDYEFCGYKTAPITRLDILINDEKISKSLGNGITLEEIEQNGYSLEVLRLHILESHYRSQSKFSWDSLDAARNRLSSYRAMADLRWQPINNSSKLFTDSTFDEIQNDILNPLSNDLNTPQLLANISSREASLSEDLVSENAIDNFIRYLSVIDKALGLSLSERTNIEHSQKELIKQREEARSLNNWVLSDEIRDTLLSQNIGLKDTQYGTIWYRV
jgi:cysteinyl-tRNA synthetase